MELKTMTVGFAEIGKFSYLSDDDPERTIGVLQSFYQVIGNIITEFNGRIIKYIGNSVFFVFDSPKTAILAGRRITEIEMSGMKVYVSLATGELYIGRVGHSTFQVDDVLGPPVARAVSLIEEAKNLPTQLSVCERTLDYMK